MNVSRGLPAMPHARIPGLDKPLPRLVLGTMGVREDDLASGFRLFDEAVANGFTAFDTARAYPGEPVIGRWMAERGNRDDMFIITKGGHPDRFRNRVTPNDLAQDLDASLASLRTDRIDLYLLHRDDTSVPVEILVEAMNDLVRSGKVRAIGVSNWSSQRLADANAYAAECGLRGFVASSPHYSLAEPFAEPWEYGSVSISGDQDMAARNWYAEEQIAVLAWSSLSQGFLSGRVSRASFTADPQSISEPCRAVYCHEPNFRRLERAAELAAAKQVSLPQLALAFILGSAMNVFPIVGAQSADEMQDCLQAPLIRLTARERDWLRHGV